MKTKNDVEYIDLENLFLDKRNPRLGEFGISDSTPETQILETLWEEMAIDELMYSIVSNGFWDYEPIIVKKENSHYISIEGNRRLAAVKLIHNHNEIETISLPKKLKVNINQEVLDDTEVLPCIVVESREIAWRYIGFKHVNGPAKWGSFAKAKYIAEIHNEYGKPINEIAYLIGDTQNTTQKLYQGLMVLEQAQRENVYDYQSDIQANRIYFSHLYTGLQRPGIKSFLQIKEASEEDPNPVPSENLDNLGQLLDWMYGNKNKDVDAVIRSQNPDLKYLDAVLQSPEATAALRDEENLQNAYELSRSSESVFEERLLASKRNLQKARAHLTTGYKGEESLLKVAGATANIADDLYEDMLRVNKDQQSRTKKKRISD